MRDINLHSTKANHQGVRIGQANTPRIIALSTSGVFHDLSLILKYKGVKPHQIDNGIQAHLYTHPEDIFILNLPQGFQKQCIENISTAIRMNCEIWNQFTGIDLAFSSSQIVLTSESYPDHLEYQLPANFSWHHGQILEAAASCYKNKNTSFQAFIFDKRTVETLGITNLLDEKTLQQAETTSFLMNKNFAMQLLHQYGDECAKTIAFERNTYSEKLNSNLNKLGLKWVFKPACGAAGMGVFSNNGHGLKLQYMIDYLKKLELKNRLPDYFQIQQLMTGTPYGVTGYFREDKSFEILEIHEQIINKNHRCIGCRWTPDIQKKQMNYAVKIYETLSNIDELHPMGLICFDMIDDKVIEVNPRLTAAGPISHILKLRENIQSHLGYDFEINQIDLNTNVPLYYPFIESGKIKSLIEDLWKYHRVIVLPQGLNPFGSSRFIFINDTGANPVQRKFLREINR